ncbi:MAG TPA: ATP-binding protein [Flavisolibacter sp.]|nr:ATP-binding protein [Flavisolibacter sp.]
MIYLLIQVYQEKNEKLTILNLYIDRVHQSATLSSLIGALQEERKLSFDYALGKAGYSDVKNIRPVTDSLLAAVDKSNDPAVEKFREYTSIDRLMQTRSHIDSNKEDPNLIMHNYSNTIFRLNTLNTVPDNIYLRPVYKDMVAQKLLTEISTYLGIIRSNVYNVLVTRKYIVETLIGTLGTYDVYKSYENEFLMKSSLEAIKAYQDAKENSDLETTNQYIDSVFKNFGFDSSLTADQWWKISNEGLERITGLQHTIWSRIENKVQSINKAEQKVRDTTLFFFVLVLNIFIVLMIYTVAVTTRMLRDLKTAAEKIAKGSTQVKVKRESNDAIGSLADCIAEIAQSNHELAGAAKAIGNGDFHVAVKPRSDEDVLANSIIQMKEALRLYSEKMEALVKERTEALENSNRDLQRFAHVVSHDLKEPLRKISMFAERLVMDESNTLSADSKNYLVKIGQSSVRMSHMIDGILAYYSVHPVHESFEIADLKAIARNIKSDLELLIEQKSATIIIGDLPQVEGVPVLLNQLFYNLINNSLKFSRKEVPPRITVDSRKKNGENHSAADDVFYEITVKDNGIGFEADSAEKIFGIFSRLHPQTSYEGTGLGLALCKRIVEYHKGKIWAESNEEGAVFKILLPQKQGVYAVVNN